MNASHRARQRFRLATTATAMFFLLALAVGAGTGSAEPERTAVAPRNTSPPTISGAQRVGQTLSLIHI